MIINVEDILDHAGVKGMKWGVRRQARKDVRSVGKTAGSLIKEARKAPTRGERLKVANRYEKEVLNVIKSKQFRDKYIAANTSGKGEMVVNALLSGGMGAMSANRIQADARRFGIDRELADARNILKEMRAIR